MNQIKHGIDWYTKGRLIEQISFPEGDVRCRWCPRCRKDNDIRYRCQATNRLLYNVDQLPEFCPIQFDESEEPTNEEI